MAACVARGVREKLSYEEHLLLEVYQAYIDLHLTAAKKEELSTILDKDFVVKKEMVQKIFAECMQDYFTSLEGVGEIDVCFLKKAKMEAQQIQSITQLFVEHHYEKLQVLEGLFLENERCELNNDPPLEELKLKISALVTSFSESFYSDNFVEALIHLQPMKDVEEDNGEIFILD